jgi:mRNA interferase MazF
MLSTIESDGGYHRGDIVLVNFVFSEETGSKRRPVLLLSSEEYMQGRQEVVVSAITSNTRRMLAGDHLMADWEDATFKNARSRTD